MAGQSVIHARILAFTSCITLVFFSMICTKTTETLAAWQPATGAPQFTTGINELVPNQRPSNQFSYETPLPLPDDAVARKQRVSQFTPYAPQQQVPVSDVPVDAEGASAVAPAYMNAAARPKKHNKSLLDVLFNLFGKPTLTKVLFTLIVLVGSFFLAGVFAKIAQIGLAVYLALKALQLVEDELEE